LEIDPRFTAGAEFFVSRNIEMIGELELGWQFCEVQLVQ